LYTFSTANGTAISNAIKEEYFKGINELKEIPNAITITIKNHSFIIKAQLNLLNKNIKTIAITNAIIIAEKKL